MAVADAGTGKGIAMTYQSGILAKLRNVEISWELGEVDVTHAGSASNAREWIGDGFYAGTVTADFLLEQDEDYAALVDAPASETVTITWPNQGTSAATDAASGFATTVTKTGPYDSEMTGSVTIRLTGDHTFVAGA